MISGAYDEHVENVVTVIKAGQVVTANSFLQPLQVALMVNENVFEEAMKRISAERKPENT